jgi:hypothetical protein
MISARENNMGFSFPVSLHEITVDQLNSLDEHLRILKDETKILSSLKEYSDIESDKILFLMERYTAIIFGATMDSTGKTELIIKTPTVIAIDSSVSDLIDIPDTIMNMLNKSLGPFKYSLQLMSKCTSYYSQMLKYKEVKFSPLGESVIMLIESYIQNVTRLPSSKQVDERVRRSVIKHGLSILKTVHLWIYQEIHLIPETVAYVHKKTESIVKDNIVIIGRSKRLENNAIKHETIVSKFKALRMENPKITKDAASRLLEEDKDIPFTARVIAKHLFNI